MNPAVRVFDDVEAMCKSNDVDAVRIATPNEYHAEHAVAAAMHGKHFVCEKPMAVSLEECDRMNEAATENGVRVPMHSKTGDPPVVTMREVIASGRLGRAIQINSWNYKGWLNNPRLPSELDTSKGGVVYRQGVHQVDIVRSLGGGMVKSVRTVTGKWDRRFDTEGNYTALLEFEDGLPATLVFNGYGRFDMTEHPPVAGRALCLHGQRARGDSLPAVFRSRRRARPALRRRYSKPAGLRRRKMGQGHPRSHSRDSPILERAA